MGKFLDLTGQRYGKLTVLERGENRGGKPSWICRCDCGKTKEVRAASLRNGHSRSCGCEIGYHTHRGYGSRLYQIWSSMRQRCQNSAHKGYDQYGARGVRVCDEWQDFAVFREWAIENGYDENAPKWVCTLDRIDNNKGYSPDNCRWVDMETQNNNKRNNHQINYHGVPCSLRKLSEITGIKYQTLYARMTRYNKKGPELWGEA